MNKPEHANAVETKNSPDHTKTGARGHASPAARPERKIPKKITETYLHNSGLYYLQRYAASATQFRKIMQRKIDKSCLHHTEQDAEACQRLLDGLVDKFSRSGLLNDTVFAHGMVSSMRRRGLSQRAILMKLQAKGLTETQIKEALEEFNTENNTDARALELTAALKLARRKKVGPYANGVEYDRNKTLAAFARAGFSFDVCRQVLEMDEDELAV